MIYFTAIVSGEKIGRELQGNAEELANALVELGDNPPDDLGEEVAEYLSDANREVVTAMLRNLLAAISEGE